MFNPVAPIGDLLRGIAIDVHAVLKHPAPDSNAIRELMCRTAILKGQLRCDASNELMRYLNNLERRIGRAYASTPTPDVELRPPTTGRHAA